MAPVPSAADIDARWLTDALSEAGVAGGAAVTSVTARSIGTGQVGENVRFVLEWSGDADELPASVVGKFPSTNEMSVAAAAATNTYVREVGFYRDLAADLPIRVPLLYHLSASADSSRFALIMEDINPAEVGDQLAGCQFRQAKLAIEAAADLHGPTMGRADELAELAWLDSPEGSPGRGEIYKLLFEGFATRYANALTSGELEMGRWLGEHLDTLHERLSAERLCLVHADFRLDNMLFGTGPAAPPLTVVDWQTAALGVGPRDVAYFIGAGLLPEDRRKHEHALVVHYAEALGRYGAEVDATTIWDQYRLGSASGYTMAVIASQIVGRTARGDAMFAAMASRHADQMGDLDLPGLLGS